MLRTIKPKNARIKRALEAKEPKEVEGAKTALFVRGSSTGERLDTIMKELMTLKSPDAIYFSKKNEIRPFEDASSLEFWTMKNDAPLFVIGHNTKKRPNNLTFVRMFDGRVLEMCEVGVTSFTSMQELKTLKCRSGLRPLMHFASELFDTHPRFIQLRSLLLDLFSADPSSKAIHLKGLECLISVSLGPTPSSLNSTTTDLYSEVDPNSKEVLATFPPVHIRTYTIQMLKSGSRTPRAALTPMGPNLDLVMRRHSPPDPDMLKEAMKRRKLPQSDIESGLGRKRKNIEMDEMGDIRAQIHLGKQDLSALQLRKMKALKSDRGKKRKITFDEGEPENNNGDDEDDGGSDGKEDQ
ncbi:Brix domain-containing protein [Cantharellus anzutake]|uniref:Brix domain-containing protein n=1 Tax=Cantharellus anzutake TaxID=1750568 RepID=UPI0019037969|nr:Brix domain-containing protein [Cantharellus anzutake]KAF8326082.1 Brix domain-containing protein [Cantharellus anzutake]